MLCHAAYASGNCRLTFLNRSHSPLTTQLFEEFGVQQKRVTVSVLEDALMKYRMNGIGRSPLVAASVLICGLLVAGCDDRVTVIRDSNITIPKGSTWAWKPVAPSKDADRRRIVSRDVISRGETVAREPGANHEIVRQRIRTAIEQTLASKGLRQVSDAQAADFLVDYHLAVRRHDTTVERVYPGGYPGLVCGPYGCWESWGGGPPEVSYENIRFREGQVVFDFVKQSTKRRAYRAIGQKPVQRDTFNQDEINEFVHHMLGKLKTNG
jgi:Domain of unknown function (DUF4136)